MTRKELEKEIGAHVLKCFDKWMGKPIGKKLVVPVQIPRKASSKHFEFILPAFGGSWHMTIDCSAPPLIEVRDEYQHRFLSPSEYFKTLKMLGWGE